MIHISHRSLVVSLWAFFEGLRRRCASRVYRSSSLVGCRMRGAFPVRQTVATLLFFMLCGSFSPLGLAMRPAGSSIRPLVSPTMRPSSRRSWLSCRQTIFVCHLLLPLPSSIPPLGVVIAIPLHYDLCLLLRRHPSAPLRALLIPAPRSHSAQVPCMPRLTLSRHPSSPPRPSPTPRVANAAALPPPSRDRGTPRRSPTVSLAYRHLTRSLYPPIRSSPPKLFG